MSMNDMKRKQGKKNRPPHPGEAERILDRRVHVFELRMAGHSYRDIGRMLGIAPSTVCKDIAAETALRTAQKDAAAEDYRALDLERIDVAVQGLMPMARAGEPKSVMALMRTLDRRAKLLGLDAPTKLAGHDGGALIGTDLSKLSAKDLAALEALLAKAVPEAAQ